MIWIKLWRNTRALIAEWLLLLAIKVAPEPYASDILLAVARVHESYFFDDDVWVPMPREFPWE